MNGRQPPVVVHVLEATLGGTRQYLANIFDISRQWGKEYRWGLIHASRRSDTAFQRLLRSLAADGWWLAHVDMVRSVSPWSDLRSVMLVRRLVRQWKPDIIHCHSSKAGAVGRIASTGLRGVQVVYSPHALAGAGRGMWGLVERGLRGLTDVVVAVSDTEAELVARLGLAAPGRVHVVRPFLTADQFQPQDRDMARRHLGVGGGPLVVGVGRLCAQKNPLQFLRVFQSVRHGVPHLKALWVGDGDLRDRVLRTARQLGVAGDFMVTGWVQDVRPYMAAANVVVSCARFESFGYVVPEAILMKRPVVATRVPGTADIMSGSRISWTCDRDDVSTMAALVSRILAMGDQADDLAASWRQEILEEFSMTNASEQLADAYSACLATGATRAGSR